MADSSSSPKGLVVSLSLIEQSRLLAGRVVSPVDLTEAHLERIAELDPILRCFITVCPERARADAARAERELARGHRRGALHGVPIALKDLFDTKGILTTAGSGLFRDRVPATDSAVAGRLRRAGAVLLGKLAMHEFAIGRPVEEGDPATGRNPWDPTRVPGGSSSGSAAAVAAGLCAGSIGSDTGASVRGPAAACGIVGMKPSRAVISRRGMVALAPSLDAAGPLARSVDDAAYLLLALTHPAATLGRDLAATLTRGLGGMRVAVPSPSEELWGMVAADVRRAFEAALDVLARGGAITEEVILPFTFGHAAEVFRTILLVEAASQHAAWLDDPVAPYGPGVRERIREGLRYTDAQYLQARRDRALISRELETILASIDVIAAPAALSTARTFAEEAAIRPRPGTGSFAFLATLADQPSIALPCGVGENGLPIGLMLTARRGAEAILLRAAREYERMTTWHLRRPAFPENRTA